MRALKTILIIVFVLAVVLLILAFTGPKTSVVQRSVKIDAPPEIVYPMISDLRAMHEWSPWATMEKEVHNEWTGADGTIGSMQSWDGDTLGKGSQRITAMEENKSVSTELKFYEPWEATSTVDLRLTPDSNSTKVDWIMTQENNGLGRLMAVFMSLDKMVGPDFDKGLHNLKTRAEAKQAAIKAELDSRTHRGYVIQLVERPAITYIGRRNKKVKWTEFEKFYGTSFGAAYGAITAKGIQFAGHPSGVFFEWNEKDQTADVLAGIPVEGGENVKLAGFETYTVPASKMLLIPYYGAYDNSMEAHNAMDDMIKANGLVHYGNVIEEYVTDPGQEPDTSKWLTNIYYMIQ